jgi:hypothetical protein
MAATFTPGFFGILYFAISAGAFAHSGGAGTPFVEAIEVNTVLDEKGGERFTQIIAWDTFGRVRQWWMIQQIASCYRVGDQHVLAFDVDGEVRWMKSRRCKRTVTEYDPEEINRTRLAVDQRRPVW